jgi:hypothetical protein
VLLAGSLVPDGPRYMVLKGKIIDDGECEDEYIVEFEDGHREEIPGDDLELIAS